MPDAEPSAAEAAVLRAVTYASLFQFPMTCAEARRTLVGLEISEFELMSLYRQSGFLQRRIEYRQGVFVLVGHDDWIEERAGREARSLRLIASHRRFLNVLCAMPFIRLLAISGSLAHMNASRDADLDLFVITRGPRVWTVTAMIVGLSKLMGFRRSVCANFVVSDTDMTIAPQDEFSANQIVHLRPVLGADTYRAFLDANPFVRATYPNFDPRERRVFPFTASPRCASIKRVLETMLSPVSGLLEAAIRGPYGWYLRRKVRRWASPDQVRLTPTQLKLHGNSHRHAIQAEFDRACERID